MQMLLDIFGQLGADISLWHQLAVVVLMYFIAKFLFLDHLQRVLDVREEKTIALDSKADEQFAKIEKIQNDYKEKITSVNKRLKQKLEESRALVVKTEEAKYRSEEKTINDYIDKSRLELEKEIENKKEEVMKEAEQLSTDLVQKITKGL